MRNMMPNQRPPDLRVLQQLLSGTLLWVSAATLLLFIFAMNTVRIGRVSGEQVGILLDRISGKLTVINQSGVKLYNGLFSDFYVLDKTLQTLEMTDDPARGDRQGRDDLKIKTTDGSDVYVDIKVQYRIVAELAEQVILTSGPGDLYKQKWARDYVRSIARNYLGELTTEEFYDSSKRDAKLVMARAKANERLERFGLKIDSLVIPQRPHFYKEYEEMIKRKKLADQAVLEEQSKARASKQRQLTMIVQETNRKNVVVEQFSGLMQQRIIAAEADSERARKAAEAYFARTTINADAQLYSLQKQAEAVRERKTAEADGIKALRDALAGAGGRTMVKLEYARKLKDVALIGKPFSVQGTVERFEHLKGPAATGRE